MPQLFPSAPAGFGRAAWQPATWTFTREEELSIPTICQFGRDYAGARDGCVYHYFIHPRNESSGTVQKPGTVYLARSPRDRMPDRASYGFFAGMRGAEPEWTRDVTRKKPVFEDRDNGVGWVMSVTFNPGLRRYPLMTDHIHADRGNPGVFDAAEPWGPWTTVLYLNEAEGTNFAAGRNEPDNTFFRNTPVKWQSADGRDFTLVFTGAGRGQNYDSLNLIRGRIATRIDSLVSNLRIDL